MNSVVPPAGSVSLSDRALAAGMPGREQARYLDELNSEQRSAVETLDGPVLLLAGAGTGKTRALTTRIAHLINSRDVRPYRILAVTFTNKAAREMKTRVGQILGEVVEGMPWLGTFHSISARMLRYNAELAGLKSNFTILDTDDQVRLLKQVLQAADIDQKMFPARHLAGMIDRWKNRAWTPEKVPDREADWGRGRAIKLYSDYQDRLKTLNCVDFGDLLLHMVQIFSKNQAILDGYCRRLKYILVDEYQDANVAQYLWLRLLASQHQNICCVGDDDQSIYGWRGAEVGNILRFEKDFPNSKVFRLEQNYRSTGHILAAASHLISFNRNRLGKTLWTQSDQGEKVRLISHYDSVSEAVWVGDEIEAIQKGSRGRAPVALDDIAILQRTTFQMRQFEDRFLRIGLPYRVIGGPRFYERREIRDAIAYFRLAISPTDNLAFERIINTPRRGIGDKSFQMIFNRAREAGISLVEASGDLVSEGQFAAKTRRELDRFLADLEVWGRIIQGGEKNHVEVAEQILDESGYAGHWASSKAVDAPGRLENLKELVRSLHEFENLQGFLDHVSLVMDHDQETGEERVSLMTLHAAKGLEFPVVFLPGWEDGLFPSQRALATKSGNEALEEERRLGYVGITRAEKICYISFASRRRAISGEWTDCVPSRFIDELPETHVDVLPSHDATIFGAAVMPDWRFGETGFSQDAAAGSGIDTPGWKRANARRNLVRSTPGRSPVSGGRQPNLGDATRFSVGDRVFHQKFGYGRILRIDHDKVRVRFETSSEWSIAASYLSPATTGGE